MLTKFSAVFIMAAAVLTIAYCLFGVGADDVCVVDHAGADEKSAFPRGEGEVRNLHSPQVEVGRVGELPMEIPGHIWPPVQPREPDYYLVHFTTLEYTVQQGDTLWTLEERFGVRFELLFEMNRELLERNFHDRCPGPGTFPLSHVGHCSSPEATLQCGMVLKIPDEVWIEPVYHMWL